MIVVDSSVWIDHFRDRRNDAVHALRSIEPVAIILGDMVLLELLQGARSDEQAARIEHELAGFRKARMLDMRLAVEAAANFRKLRSLGLTIRKSVDLIIATYCIVHGHSLLHRDRDFDGFETHLGLEVAR